MNLQHHHHLPPSTTTPVRLGCRIREHHLNSLRTALFSSSCLHLKITPSAASQDDSPPGSTRNWDSGELRVRASCLPFLHLETSSKRENMRKRKDLEQCFLSQEILLFSILMLVIVRTNRYF